LLLLLWWVIFFFFWQLLSWRSGRIMSESSADASGSRASSSASSVGPYRPPQLRFLLNNNNPEQALNSRSSASLRTPGKVPLGDLASLQPKFSVTCFSARNAPNADQPGTTTDLSSTATRESALEDVLLKRVRSNQPSRVPESFQSDRLQIFLFDSRIPSSLSTSSLGTSSSSDRVAAKLLVTHIVPRFVWLIAAHRRKERKLKDHSLEHLLIDQSGCPFCCESAF
jgi:hypothetical protein